MNHSIVDTLTSAMRAVEQPTPPSFKPVANALTHEGSKAAELVRHWADQGAAASHQALDVARREARALTERTQGYVQAQPTRSLLLAVVAGAAITGLAMLLTRRD